MNATAVFPEEPKTQYQPGKELRKVSLRTPDELAEIVKVAASSEDWVEHVRLGKDHRWYERLHHEVDYDLWVISWMTGQSTGFHDHGPSSGAYIVAMGQLQELRSDAQTHTIRRGESVAFDHEFAHDVRNVSETLAVSIHAYSPPLTEMNHYDLDAGELILREGTHHQVSKSQRPTQHDETPVDDSHIERVLTAARSRLKRVSPHEALEAAARPDTVLVDIRPAGQRASERLIPGALIVERNVLEWRFDPGSSARLPIANSADLQVIIFCSQGYASSLAAADLQDIGLWRATDVIGGFQAWRDAGLPTTSASA